MTQPPRVHIDPDVEANYRQIKAERGYSWTEFAGRMEVSDRRLAAWMRQMAAAEDEPAGDVKLARGRKSAGDAGKVTA